MDKWNPDQYSKFKNERSKPFWDLLKMVQPINQAAVLDLGCGSGELTKQLHQYISAKNTVGIDSSDNMLQKAIPLKSESLSFKKMDIRNFDSDQKFDLVFSNAALQWVNDHRTLIPKLLGAVKTGGQIALQVPYNFDHPSHIIAADVAHTLFPTVFEKHKRQLYVLPVEQYSELLFKNNFKQQDCLVRVYGHPMNSGYEVIEWTKGTLLTSYESRLSRDDFNKFLTEYTDVLISIIGKDPYYYAFKRMLIWGQQL